MPADARRKERRRRKVEIVGTEYIEDTIVKLQQNGSTSAVASMSAGDITTTAEHIAEPATPGEIRSRAKSSRFICFIGNSIILLITQQSCIDLCT